jgi:hypothetical protein
MKCSLMESSVNIFMKAEAVAEQHAELPERVSTQQQLTEAPCTVSGGTWGVMHLQNILVIVNETMLRRHFCDPTPPEATGCGNAARLP